MSVVLSLVHRGSSPRSPLVVHQVIKGAERVASHEADPLLESPLYRDHDGSLKRK